MSPSSTVWWSILDRLNSLGSFPILGDCCRDLMLSLDEPSDIGCIVHTIIILVKLGLVCRRMNTSSRVVSNCREGLVSNIRIVVMLEVGVWLRFSLFSKEADSKIAVAFQG